MAQEFISTNTTLPLIIHEIYLLELQQASTYAHTSQRDVNLDSSVIEAKPNVQVVFHTTI